MGLATTPPHRACHVVATDVRSAFLELEFILRIDGGSCALHHAVPAPTAARDAHACQDEEQRIESTLHCDSIGKLCLDYAATKPSLPLSSVHACSTQTSIALAHS